MRLFTGIDMPEEVVDIFERLLARFRPAANLKWSPAYNMHITLRFIGEWPEAKLPELQEALARVPPRRSIHIDLCKFGWFPNPRRPRVFWVGVEGDPAIGELAHDIDSALEPVGLAREQRPFSPHLTLARIKQPVPLDKLHQILEKMETTDVASFEADRFYLYRSQPGSAGSIYTKLSEFRFAGAPATVNR